jgi:hypothetical protein
MFLLNNKTNEKVKLHGTNFTGTVYLTSYSLVVSVYAAMFNI